MKLTLQDVIGFVAIAAALIVIVGYASPPPTGQHWINSGKKPGESVMIHAERG